MKYTIVKKIIFILILIITNVGCKKQDDYLNYKTNNSDVVPSSLANYQALLDNDAAMNQNYPLAGLVGTDNYYILNSSLPYYVGNPVLQMYTWSSDIWLGGPSADWEPAYQRIEYANVVLDGISKISIDSSTQAAYNNIKGSALFYRAFDFYNIASIFCKPYTASTASADLGIVIRLTSDINVKSTRSTIQQTYDQIIKDLKTAVSLLPTTSSQTTRPSSIAANGLLAKIYLAMEDYTNAGIFANKALTANGNLLDFNNTGLVTLNTGADPFPSNPSLNPEIIYYAGASGYYVVQAYNSDGRVDSVLYQSYNNSDLRKTVFYQIAGDGTPQFVGTYDAYSYSNFAGMGTNEMYLIRAECYVRQGNISASLQDLNNLLNKRFVTGTFAPLTATNQDTLLAMVLKERRKELPFNNLTRWEDLRRLNKDTRFARTLTRVANGNTYTLPPNDKKYVYPIPDKEIQLSSIPQNPR